jgi:hypothetical protein
MLFFSLKINREHRNRFAPGYLSPVALTALFLILMLSLTIPRLLDSISLLTENYAITEVSVGPDSLGWNSLQTGGHRYFYNQWQIQLEPGERYRIEYTPRSRYLVRATPVETAVVHSRNLAIQDQDEDQTEQP